MSNYQELRVGNYFDWGERYGPQIYYAGMNTNDIFSLGYDGINFYYSVYMRQISLAGEEFEVRDVNPEKICLLHLNE